MDKVWTALDHRDTSVNMILVHGNPLEIIRTLLLEYGTYRTADPIFRSRDIVSLGTVEQSRTIDRVPGSIDRFHIKADQEDPNILRLRMSQIQDKWTIWIGNKWIPMEFILSVHTER